MKDKSVLNYFLSSSLKSLRDVPPYFSLPKDGFFEVYEPKFKEYFTDTSNSVFAVLFQDKTIQKEYSIDEISSNKKILSWLVLRKPNYLVYAYTRNEHRQKGYAGSLFDICRDYIGIGNIDRVIMDFYSFKGFKFLESLGRKYNFKPYSRTK